MRRVFIRAIAATLLLAAPAMADKRIMIDDFDGFEGISYPRGDPMPQMVRSILQLQREGGMDNWAWRDTVESQLVGLGSGAVPCIQTELALRDGYEADALQVALFRIENSPLAPRDALQHWGEKRFGVSISPAQPSPNPLKISRVMDNREGAGLTELFPHHLFYVLECKKTRLVVALAADAKVQPLEDDATLAHFIRTEGQPQMGVNDKSRLASAAALLMLARSVTPYRPEFRQQNLDTDLRTYNYTLQFEGFRSTAMLTFTAAGMLDTLSSGQVKPDNKPAAPIAVPTSTAPPPIMPE